MARIIERVSLSLTGVWRSFRNRMSSSLTYKFTNRDALESEEKNLDPASGKRFLNPSRISPTVSPSRSTSPCCSVYWRIGVGIRTVTLISELLESRSLSAFSGLCTRLENLSTKKRGVRIRSSRKQHSQSPCSRYPLWLPRQTHCAESD